ncbi:MAG: hypothetical protein ACR2P0_01800, partial [Acidimicrobiales bacterium]
HEIAATVNDPRGEALAVAHGGLIYLLESRTDNRRGRIPNLGALWVEVKPDGHIAVGERIELVDEHEVAANHDAERL